MRICYVLLSPTFGMHQYTADLANRAVQAGHDVHLVTTVRYPAHRYLLAVQVYTPVDTYNTGFSVQGVVRVPAVTRVVQAIRATQPDVIHLTGPHLWNLYVIPALRKHGIPVVHTLHDLDPHPGTAYGPLLHLWNRTVLRQSDHLLVHGVCYRDRLRALGVAENRITCTPLLHLFLGQTWLGKLEHLTEGVTYEPFALFFGRLEKYKGVDHLITAWAMLNGVTEDMRLVLAGSGKLAQVWAGALPPGVEVRNRLIEDAEAVDLFRRCSLLVLPYMGATQSALIPAAYFFRKPVLAAPSGALHEYVQQGNTGWLVAPEHPPSLARALSAALADLEQLRIMGAAGREWYTQRRQSETQTLQEMYSHVARR